MITCLECNKKFNLLQSHLRHKHNMSTDEYRLKHGNDVEFMSESVLQKKKQNGYSCWSIDDRMARGETEDEAKANIKAKKKETFGSHTTCRSTVYWELQGLSKSEAAERVKEIQTRDLNYFLKKYGDNGKLIFEEIQKKKGISNSKEAMLQKGLTEPEIKLMRDNLSLESIMTKCDVTKEEAEQIRSSRLENHCSCWGLDYWIDKGFTEEDARLKISQLQRRDLEYFVQKYGEEQGKERYNSFIKLSTGHSVGKFASKESIKFFSSLVDWCEQNAIEIEFEKYVSVDTKTYYIDCVVPSISLAIEYDGKAFHADPENIDVSWFSAKKHLSYWDSINADQLKTERLESIGYKVIRIHSSRSEEYDLVKIVKDIKNGNF